MRQGALEEFRLFEPITETLLELLCITLRHFPEKCVLKPRVLEQSASAVCAYFGALNCVAPSFLASSAPLLHVGCRLPGMDAHLLNAATAASKCEVFWSAIART